MHTKGNYDASFESTFLTEARAPLLGVGTIMFESVKLLATVSRAEFLLPNLGSLIMGLAWGASPPLSLINGVILVVLSFATINLSSAIGAQANTLSDYELDLKDDRKRQLVHALDSLGQKRLKACWLSSLFLPWFLFLCLCLSKGSLSCS
jgi:4-hydroxybenzoate polyprenyltransferase